MSRKSKSGSIKRGWWAALAVIFGVFFVLQAGGMMIALFTPFSFLMSDQAALYNLVVVLIFYIAFVFAKQQFNQKNKRKLGLVLTKKHYIIIVALAMISFAPLLNRPAAESGPTDKKSKKSLTEQWLDFKDETARTTNYIAPIQEVNNTLGCFEDSGQPKDGFCQFNNYEFYAADSDYEKYLRDMIAHLLKNGYSFPDSKYGSEGMENYTEANIERKFESNSLTVILDNKALQRNIVITPVSKQGAKLSIHPESMSDKLTAAFDNGTVVYAVLYHTK